MSLNKGKLPVAEIDETRCVILEKGVAKERVDFLAKLLQHNNIESKIQEIPPKTEEGVTTYTIGVPDVTFNPVMAVYKRMLETFNGERVTPDYWNQKTNNAEPNYWDLSKK